MKKIKLKDLEIIYDNSIKNTLDNVVNIINKNYNLFLEIIGSHRIISFIPTNDSNILFISNFEKFFHDGVYKIFNNEQIKEAYDNPNILSVLYIEILCIKLGINSNILFKQNNISEKTLETLIAYKYFEKNRTFKEFVDYLKNENNFDFIFEWLQKETRWAAYNYLLEIMVNLIKENDNDFFRNINSISTIIFNQFTNDIPTNNKQDKEQKSISLQEIEKLFYDFLKYINAPEDWKKLYEYLKNNNLIEYENKINNIDNSKCFKDDEGILKINISTEGTIKDFCKIIHEFVHYISWYKNDLKIRHSSILEFPSIYFEQLSFIFLINNGYCYNEIEKAINERKENNKLIYQSVSSQIYDLFKFIKKGKIQKNSKVIYWKNNFKIIQETQEKLSKILNQNGKTINFDIFNFSNNEIEDMVDKECDDEIIKFLKNESLIIEGYQYLIGSYIANEVINQTMDDKKIIDKMINITNELGDINLQKLFVLFNIEDSINNNLKYDKYNNQILSKKINNPLTNRH